MRLRGQLHNREAEAAAAIGARARPVHAVETIEYPVDTLWRDSDACVGDDQAYSRGLARQLHRHTPPRRSVVDRIVQEVDRHSLEQLFVTPKRYLLPPFIAHLPAPTT